MAFNLDFTDKVVLVTGSSSGIGESTAILFSRLGAKVIVHGRSRSRVSDVALKCTQVSPKQYKPLEVISDVANEEEVDRMMDEVIAHFHQLDVVVNNAGLGGGESNASLKEWDAFMNTNLRSCYQICLRAYPLLEKSKGVIINNSRLDMLTRGLAVLWGPKGIRVNAVNPGQIQTPIWENATGLSKEERDVLWKAVCKKTPVGR
ncbi:unnamed protein product, partial [Oppiella nova]